MRLLRLLRPTVLAVSLLVSAWPRLCAEEAPVGTAAVDAASRQLLLSIFRELIEINTVIATGDTAKAADAMAARLLAAGFPAQDVQVFKPAPRKGNLVARLRGTGARRPVLLLAHIDVVDARREDWSVDPFTLTEKDGFFYGRGTTDDKQMAASLVANLIRFKQEGYIPDRDFILVLATDEEAKPAGGPFGMEWLLEHHRDLLAAAYALNEGGGVSMRKGHLIENALQTSEKVYQSYWLEVTKSGGHSAWPGKENAIYQLADGLLRLSRHQFPVHLNETTRAYFAKLAERETGQVALDMKALSAPEPDPAAIARLSENTNFNVILRTTCVATRMEAGQADNVLPQRARALVNCRIMPGESEASVRQTLVRVLADEQISVVPEDVAHVSEASPLSPELVRPLDQLTEEYWPGTPVVPTLCPGATDARFLRNAGIPTYGIGGYVTDLDDSRGHARDERIPVATFYEGDVFLRRLLKMISGGR